VTDFQCHRGLTGGRSGLRWVAVNRLCPNVLMILFALSSFGVVPVYANEPKMLIETVAGKTYQRTSYDAGGVLVTRSILRTGTVQAEDDGSVMVTTDVETFSPSGESQGSRQVRWSCDPAAASMLMNILLLAGDELRRETRIEVKGPPLRFPASANADTALNSLELNLRLRGGLLSFFGTRTRIVISNRRIIATDAMNPGNYTVESEVDATVYFLGFPAKRKRFESLESVRAGIELVRQRITFADGSYSMIEQIANGAKQAGGQRLYEHKMHG